MKKNIRDYKCNGYQYAYFLDCIICERIGVTEDSSDELKVFKLFNDFNRSKNTPNYKRDLPRLVDRFEHYLRGVTTDIEYDNYSIGKLGESWGLCPTEKKKDAFINNWWHMAAVRYIQLGEYFGVNMAELY